MRIKGLFVLAGIYLFLYILNYLTPMAFGDDYLYSFVWQGKSMFAPLAEDAVRVSTWNDLLVSQVSHYLTWGGRTVAHVLDQFFLWVGKDIFNLLNALIGTFLVIEIYWLIHKGKTDIEIIPSEVIFIFFALWTFTPAFSTVFFWQTAACNYLWTNVILLGFLIPYMRSYFSYPEITLESGFRNPVMFFGGILAGWTNENSVCWIILVLFIYIFSRKDSKTESWMYAGFAGLVIGYVLLMGAPGNLVRLHVEKEGAEWLSLKAISEHLKMLSLIILFQALLWYFNLRSLFSLKKEKDLNQEAERVVLLVKILCLLSFCSIAMMLFSTGFPPRSGFFGTVQLIIAAGILLQIQENQKLNLINISAKKFLMCVGCVYFIMTATTTISCFYNDYMQIKELLTFVKQERFNNDKVLSVKSLAGNDKTKERLSGFHLLGYELSENENDWKNVAFARYFGIKGVRMIKGGEEKECSKRSRLE